MGFFYHPDTMKKKKRNTQTNNRVRENSGNTKTLVSIFKNSIEEIISSSVQKSARL